MKKNLFFCIMVMLFTITVKAQTGLYVPQLAAFDEAMLNLMSTYDVPGGQLAITYNGKLVYNRGFGFANVSTQDSVYPNSIFRIASVSKTITATAIMKLYEQGLLDLDDRVFGTNGLLNDAVYSDILDPRDTLITIRMLLQHSGGWNREVSGDIMFNAYNIATAMGVPSPPSASEVIQAALKYVMLDFAPGTQYAYSNLGFCILGRVIEKLTNEDYENYVRNTLLLPLGCHQTQLGNNLLSNQLPNEVTYYDYPNAPLGVSIYDNVTQVPMPYGAFNLEFMDAHGGWVSSCEELLRFVCAIDRFSTRPDILLPSTMDTMTAPSLHNPNYGCGIGVNTANNWYHTGSLPGTTSEFVRKGNGLKINWAVLLNTRTGNSGELDAAVDQLVWNVLPSITSWPDHDLFDSSIGIADLHENQTAIRVYPNPVKDKLYFSDRVNVKLTNIAGQLISDNPNVTMLDISNQPTGMYFLTFTDPNGQVIQVHKIVKE